MKKDHLTARIIACIIGNLIIALGVTMSKIADFGIDPFNGMCMSVSAFLGIAYPVYTWTFNLVCFTVEILWGRKYIHIGTFINWFLISFAVSFFLKMYDLMPAFSGAMPARIALLAVSLIVTSFGLAVYQVADLGIAPYDAIPIIFCDRFKKFPYFWARILLDSAAVIGMLLTHSNLIGIGTLLTALGLGPVVHMFMNLLKKAIARYSGKKEPAGV